MKKTSVSILVLGVLALSSCQKTNYETDFNKEVSNETETFRLPESGFSINVIQPLSDVQDDRFTSGVLEYEKDGKVLATFDYADETDAEHGNVTVDGEKKKCGLGYKKGGDWKGKKGKEYKKVIVEPIVKTDDCGYIVSGIIKYYDIKSGAWLATIDFGDGTCDDIAEKTTKKGVYTFTVSTYF